MSDTTPFGFGKFVPGFDFLQNLAKGASGHIPKLPSLSNWVAPTISVDELEKRVDELKAVQFWLEQNSRALTATIQALEVQKMTLATLQGMNFSMGDLANAFTPKAADTAAGSAAKASGAPAAARPSEAPAASGKDDKADGGASKAGSPGVIDPLQWWGALTQQFQQIAASALKDTAAQKTAIGATQNLAKDAFKTATDMASQMAAQGVQSLQDAARLATTAKPVAAKKAAAPKTVPAQTAARAAPAKSPAAAKKAPARRAASKSAR
ncbi:hypothetical protein B2J86_10460 [Acidovorax sp. SRB_14]|uniref:PhaM family polyhydroxyalkanoate granule multifunctional regulatory protein n=1 Tax=unclassified Acidovorax TaxID=2684926 RepID=UPI00145C4760|nr:MULTISPECIES: PhaM family polyhydroxyalkanoate granule multifunctional regulatory protein [unclassified Acidovorax]NMM77158.1 hypothetical protein [Acidovorax sp. SRB_24]NMM81339.1 hypothetical protein [Acidovorax sp. SRB_14]NMM88890.1 hypothetical protein [Rhodococcus sp. SRB_17]